VAENRELRRGALLDAAAALILRSGSFTVAEVTAAVGLSRSAFYEYFVSAGDLAAQVLLDELDRWHEALASAVGAAGSAEDPHARVAAWIEAVLGYVADGRHALVRAAAATDIPADRRQAVQDRHRALVQPLAEALADLGILDAAAAASLVWGAVDATVSRVESGVEDADAATTRVTAFVRGGLEALRTG
jgi:AcrR family transcriptional regulator